MKQAWLAAVFALAGCASWRADSEDRSRLLPGSASSELGPRLEVSVRDAPAPLERGLVEAVRAELEAADLFLDVDEVPAPADEAPVGSRNAGVARLLLTFRGETRETIYGTWRWFSSFTWHPFTGRVAPRDALYDPRRQDDAYLVRYDVDAELVDPSGAHVLDGVVSGIAWDDATDPDRLGDDKKTDVALAAQREVAAKIGRALRAAAAARARPGFERLERIHLPPGVGPVPIAIVGFDDDPASARRSGPALARALAGALGRLGPDLSVVAPEEIEESLQVETDAPPRSVVDLREEDVDRLVPRFGARLFVVGKIESGAGGLSVRASLIDAQRRLLGQVEASGEGPGAIASIATSLARSLASVIEANPPREVVRREDD